MIQIYNTMSGQKEALEPLEPGRLRIYVCGPTVYDMAHIGHGRCYVAFDTIVRYLRRAYDVTYVRNYTDVEDKIIKRANELGVPAQEVTEKFIAEFKEDMASLSCAEPDIEPKVTEHMDEIVALVESLIERGAAYASEGDVYFAVRGFSEYGKLSKRNVDDMRSGARIAPGEKKRDPLDFALWKQAREGEPYWESPWGRGRPGWHIECSAMSRCHLGETLDIHGGGKDLIFPHHENEIAQSEGATEKRYARYWIHNGFVQTSGEKMSKSLGNFSTVRDLLAVYHPQVLRAFLLSVHYRSPIDFNEQSIIEAEGRVKYFYQTLARIDEALAGSQVEAVAPYRDPSVEGIAARFAEAMNDDFNTARALADLSGLFNLANEIVDKPGDAEVDARTLRAIRDGLDHVGEVLGLFSDAPAAVLEGIEAVKRSQSGIDAAAVENLIEQRAAARASKDFARADEIRDELAAMGVTIKDGPQGTTWEAS